MRRSGLALLGLLVAGLGAAPAAPQAERAERARPVPAAAPAPDAPARVRRAVAARLAELHAARAFPGASVALVLPGGELVTAVAGLADVEGEVAMTPEHRFLAGSVGKTFVGALALLYAHEGRLALDDRLAEHLDAPWLARLPNGAELRLADLLRHQSGLPRYVFEREFWDALLADRDRRFAPAELLAYVLDAEPLFAPGADWAYSDTNYLLVGLVLEAAGGAPYYDALRERLLVPHGLADVVPSDRRELERLAVGYTAETNPFGLPPRLVEDGRYCFNPQFEWTGGGLATTPADLARWAAILWSGRAFDGPYLEELLASVPCSLGPGRRYGVATMVIPTELGVLHAHEGFFPGYRSSAGRFAEHDLAIAFQMNTDDGRRLGRRLSELVTELAALALAELEGAVSAIGAEGR